MPDLNTDFSPARQINDTLGDVSDLEPIRGLAKESQARSSHLVWGGLNDCTLQELSRAFSRVTAAYRLACDLQRQSSAEAAGRPAAHKLKGMVSQRAAELSAIRHSLMNAMAKVPSDTCTGANIKLQTLAFDRELMELLGTGIKQETQWNWRALALSFVADKAEIFAHCEPQQYFDAGAYIARLEAAGLDVSVVSLPNSKGGLLFTVDAASSEAQALVEKDFEDIKGDCPHWRELALVYLTGGEGIFDMCPDWAQTLEA